MAYLVTFHWGWLLASLLLGLAMGWIAVVHRGQGVSKLTARWLAGLAAALVAAALARVIPGRPGYWLDLGLIMFALYLAGCAVGSWLRDWALSRHRAGGLRFRPTIAVATGKFGRLTSRKLHHPLQGRAGAWRRRSECSKTVHPVS